MRQRDHVDAPPPPRNFERFTNLLDQLQARQKLLNRQPPNRNQQRRLQQIQLPLQPWPARPLPDPTARGRPHADFGPESSHAATEKCANSGAVPSMLDRDGQAVKRNFVHVEDLISAISTVIDHPKAKQQTFNVC